LDDDAIGVLVTPEFPDGVPAPSSILNEIHHANAFPGQQIFDSSNNLHQYWYPGGLISGNVFACDITDPLNIMPVPGSQGANTGLGDPTTNICGLSFSNRDVDHYTGTDDFFVLPNGNLIATWMGAKGQFSRTSGSSASPLGPPIVASLPPVLTTPGGLVESDPFTHTVVGEYSSVPSAPVFGHGTCDDGTVLLGPRRYLARAQIKLGGVDASNEPVDPVLGIGADTLDACVDTATRGAHPHGIFYRADLKGKKVDRNGHRLGRTDGILLTSDYADPVSLAITGSGAGPASSGQDLGTTVRFWDLSNLTAGPYAISQMPDGPRVEENLIHEEPEGLMALYGTNKPGHKGAFVASMCGGVIYYTADITEPQPKFKIVYDFGACTGASVFVVTQNDRYLILPISGIQTDVSPPAPEDGDAVHNRDYVGEHNARVVALDIRKLLRAGKQFKCDAAPVAAWDNSGPLDVFGRSTTVGPSGALGLHRETGTVYWPNNGASDCPTIASVVDYSGAGDDGLLGTADDHPDIETSRGGPHFTIPDKQEKYVAVSNYFVDLREYAINTTGENDVETLLTALGLGLAYGPYTGFPPSTPTDVDLPNIPPPGGLGALFGQTNVLPGTGSVGDDTVCMMRFNRWTGQLTLDRRFNRNDPTSPAGCVDLDFGDTGKRWPGSRAARAGNATPHAMMFTHRL
jgi:hypothetical protein